MVAKVALSIMNRQKVRSTFALNSNTEGLVYSVFSYKMTIFVPTRRIRKIAD